MKITGSLLHLMTTPAVYLGIGSVVITLPFSTISSTALAIGTLITAANELNTARGKVSSNTKSANAIVLYIKDKLFSPGFFPWFQSFWYLWTACEALLANEVLRSIAFILFTVGALANANISNRNYSGLTREKLGLEKFFLKIWHKLNLKIRVILKDPGFSFPTANLLIILIDLNLKELYSNLVFTTLFILGALLGLTAIARSIYTPLTSGKSPKLTGGAMAAAGLSEFATGTPAVLFGNTYVGIATLIFGISNLLYAKAVDPKIFQRLLSRKNKA